MNLADARALVGRIVHYKPGGMVAMEGVEFPKTDVGVITSVNDSYVFVRFEDDQDSKACYADSVNLANPDGVLCSGCKQEIDPNTCGCGAARRHHGNVMDEGHSFVPSGCDCFRAKPVTP